jgi:hypothetical protein
LHAQMNPKPGKQLEPTNRTNPPHPLGRVEPRHTKPRRRTNRRFTCAAFPFHSFRRHLGRRTNRGHRPRPAPNEPKVHLRCDPLLLVQAGLECRTNRRSRTLPVE